jgi:predicted amidohydrolase YtcJ
MMQAGLLYVIFLLVSMGAGHLKADLMLYNGIVYTVNDSFSIEEAIVIRSGKILAVGKSADLSKLYKAEKEIDLEGKAVFPGFIDPHCHFYSYGLTLQQADLTGTSSVTQVIEILKMHRNKMSATWLLGRGWDQNDWNDKQFPHKSMLDKVFPDIPVYLVRIDGHAAFVNSKALEIAGIQAPSHVEGGEILADDHGPTGILIDNAMSLVQKFVPDATLQEKCKALSQAEKNCFAVGLTTISDAGLDKEEVLLIDSLQHAGKLSMRIYAMLNPTIANIRQFINHGIYQTDRLHVRSIKLFADGALGSRGALLIEPYSDDPTNRGLQVSETSFLSGMCKMALEKGYQVNTHCIGDSAVRLMLRLYSEFLPEGNDLRWRIEHAQVLDPADFDLFGRHNIIPSVQTTHATSDMYWAEERLGPARIKYAYAWQTLLKQNGWLANGSDFPVESINPIYGFYAGITRKDLQGYPPGGFYVGEALSREQALRAMTIWAAKACFEDQVKGSLEKGKFADLVVLDKDIMQISEDMIPEVKVLQTYSNGELVYAQ